MNGVVANIASLLAGAAEDAGFKGISGRFDQRELLCFDVDPLGRLHYRRVDTGATVTVSARLDHIPSDPHIALLLKE